MAQISKGDTFVDGQQVTGARLNQLVDSSVLLVGAITDQPSITANTLQATDTTLVNDAGVLKEATIGDILNSNLPVSTSSITGGTGVDLVLTPAAGQKVDIAGNIEADDINVTDDLTVGDDATISGDLIVTGGSTLTGNVIADNGFTSNGVANFTGTLQVNGTVGYVLTEIVDETMTSTTPAVGNTAGVFTSAAFTKPADEIWVFELDYHAYGITGWGFTIGFRYNSTTAYSGAYKYSKVWQVAGNTSPEFHHENVRWVAGTGTTFTAETVKCDTRVGSSSNLNLFATSSTISAWVGYTTVNVEPSKFRIYKYKTA